MKQLTTNELKQINGGAVSKSFLALIPLGISLVVGIVDGFLRPLKCN